MPQPNGVKSACFSALPIPKLGVLCLVALFAILAHLVFIGILPARWRVNQSTDYYEFYEPVARNIVAGNGLVAPDGAPALEYPPGFPLLLASAFAGAETLGVPEDFALRLEIVLSVALTAILVYLVAEHVFQWRTALIAVFLWSTYPLQLWLTKQPDSGQPFTVLFLLSVYLFVLTLDSTGRAWSIPFAIGLLVGLGSLIRPIGIALSAVFVLCWCLSKFSWQRLAAPALLLVIGNLIVILPWELWARHAAGRWIPISTNGPASMLDGITLSAIRRPLDLSVPAGVREVIGEYVTNRRELTTAGKLVAFTAAETLRHPVAIAELAVIKAARSWYATDSRQFETANALVQSVYVLLGCWGLALIRNRQTLLVILLTTYYWGMSILTLSIVRYLLPVMPLLLMCAAALLARSIPSPHHANDIRPQIPQYLQPEEPEQK